MLSNRSYWACGSGGLSSMAKLNIACEICSVKKLPRVGSKRARRELARVGELAQRRHAAAGGNRVAIEEDPASVVEHARRECELETAFARGALERLQRQGRARPLEYDVGLGLADIAADEPF